MAKLTRDEWIAGALHALQHGGIDALNVEPLAKRLAVTKGSFYHHFSDRRALHLAMLDSWEQSGTSRVIIAIDASSADAKDQLRRLCIRTLRPDPETDSIENAIRSWASSDELVAEAVARVDERRISYTSAILRRVGLPPTVAHRRALLFYRLLIGEFMWRSSGGKPMTKREMDDVIALISATI